MGRLSVCPDPDPDAPVPPPHYARVMPADRRPVDAAAVAAAVAAHPGVAALDGGPWGTVASHLPGRVRVLGVRIGIDDEPVEIAVVARLGVPLPQLAAELAGAVHGVLGPVPVDVTFSDVVPAVTAAPRA